MLSISTQLVIIHGTSKTPMRNTFASLRFWKWVQEHYAVHISSMTGHANYVRLYKLIRDSLLTNDFHRIHTHGDTLNRSDNKWHLVTYYSSLSSSLVLLERFNFYLEGIDFITQKDVTVFINTQFIGKQCQFVSWGCLEVLEFLSLLYILIKYTNSIAHRPHNFAFLFRVIDYMII